MCTQVDATQSTAIPMSRDDDEEDCQRDYSNAWALNKDDMQI